MNCIHHWLIALPQGPTSPARCKRCGDERQFRNSKDDYGPAERSVKAHSAYCATDKTRWQETYRK